MLDDPHEEDLIDRLWPSTSKQALAPHCGDDDSEEGGPTSLTYYSRRAFHRISFRNRAILLYDGATFGAYTRDLSRTGLSLLSPVQLFPQDIAYLVLAGPRKVAIEVRRCRRLADACYEVGCRFTKSEPELAQLLLRLTRG